MPLATFKVAPGSISTSLTWALTVKLAAVPDLIINFKHVSLVFGAFVASDPLKKLEPSQTI